MPYTYEKSSNDQYELVPEGEYEAFVEKASIMTTKNGKQKVALRFRIRTDVEQPGKNRIVFDDIWKEKDTEFFNRKRVNQLLGTQELKDGTEFSGIEDILKVIEGSNLIIKVGIEFDDYSAKDRNYVGYYRSSKAKPKSIEGSPAPKPKVEIADEDLPF
jgi:hypothetical protein